MNKLMASSFSRLKKSSLFWAECVCMFVFGIILVVNKYLDQVRYHSVEILDNIFFAYAMGIGFVIALFVSRFLGKDYSDGTIRNKLIVGHTRFRIYFVNLITCIVVSVILCICFLVPTLALGIPLLGTLTVRLDTILWMLLGTFLLAVAFCSIFTMFSMICSNEAGVVAAGLLLLLALFMAAAAVYAKLEAPEFITSYVLSEDGSGGLESHTEPNPKYLTESERVYYQFIYDFLPTGQAIQYTTMNAVHLWQMPLYSLIISIGTTAAGVFIFRHKDIK